LSLDYLSSIGSILRSLFISLPILADTAAFDDFTWLALKRNYLFKLEVSIQSSSVVVTLPSFPQEIPIKAKILMNSHPNAPQPTNKALQFASFSYNSLP